MVVFPNLGNDALIVPCPLVTNDAYAHIAAFVRKAPETQIHSLWQIVGETVINKLGRINLAQYGGCRSLMVARSSGCSAQILWLPHHISCRLARPERGRSRIVSISI